MENKLGVDRVVLREDSRHRDVVEISMNPLYKKDLFFYIFGHSMSTFG